MTIPRRSTRRAARGFTLIEMMLAIGVLALILAMLASSFSAIAHSKVHAEGRLIVDREGRAAALANDQGAPQRGADPVRRQQRSR